MTKAERHYTLLFRRERPDRGMLECFYDAKRHIHFRKTLSADIAAHKRRSRASRQGWKTRKASAR